MCPIRPVESGDSWSRVCERTPSYPHLRRATDHLEQQEEPHCKPSWNANAHAASYDACGGRLVKRGRQQEVAGKSNVRPLLCKNSMVIQVTPQSRLFFKESQKQSEIQNVMT